METLQVGERRRPVVVVVVVELLPVLVSCRCRWCRSYPVVVVVAGNRDLGLELERACVGPVFTMTGRPSTPVTSILLISTGLPLPELLTLTDRPPVEITSTRTTPPLRMP